MVGKLIGTRDEPTIILLNEHHIKLPSKFVSLEPKIVKLSDLIREVFFYNVEKLTQKLTAAQTEEKSNFEVPSHKWAIFSTPVPKAPGSVQKRVCKDCNIYRARRKRQLMAPGAG